jgi:hypothetical protein
LYLLVADVHVQEAGLHPLRAFVVAAPHPRLLQGEMEHLAPAGSMKRSHERRQLLSVPLLLHAGRMQMPLPHGSTRRNRYAGRGVTRRDIEFLSFMLKKNMETYLYLYGN